MRKFTVIFLACLFVFAQASCAGRYGKSHLKRSEDSATNQTASTQIATAQKAGAQVVSIQMVSRVGDPIAGEQVYYRCMGCHSLGRNRTGPSHCGLFGRKAGSVEGFEYSTAMKDSGIIWNEASLDEFLTAPFDVVPGTTMGFAGVKQDKNRHDLIAYLKAAMDSADCK